MRQQFREFCSKTLKLGVCPERQRGETVNLLTSVFVGSSPTAPILKDPHSKPINYNICLVSLMSQVRVLPLVTVMGVAQLVERSKNVIIMGLVNSFILVRVIPNKSHIQQI